MNFDPRSFRQALGCFATGITVVTSVGLDGEYLGFTANSFNSVSLDPPLVLFSLDRGAYSLRAFEAAGVFAINILREDQEHVSVAFARALTNKWEGVRTEIWDTGSPILCDALASFDCRTTSMHDGGDHVIFVGRVLRLRAVGEGRPLIYFRGAYRQIVGSS
ncbi:MAG TPA: flavin reductase family protein [Dongiaceae bacterium]|nr:flavin reductase family protein [Dongiaceae bacterium]